MVLSIQERINLMPEDELRQFVSALPGGANVVNLGLRELRSIVGNMVSSGQAQLPEQTTVLEQPVVDPTPQGNQQDQKLALFYSSTSSDPITEAEFKQLFPSDVQLGFWRIKNLQNELQKAFGRKMPTGEELTAILNSTRRGSSVGIGGVQQGQAGDMSSRAVSAIKRIYSDANSLIRKEANALDIKLSDNELGEIRKNIVPLSTLQPGQNILDDSFREQLLNNSRGLVQNYLLLRKSGQESEQNIFTTSGSDEPVIEGSTEDEFVEQTSGDPNADLIRQNWQSILGRLPSADELQAIANSGDPTGTRAALTAQNYYNQIENVIRQEAFALGHILPDAEISRIRTQFASLSELPVSVFDTSTPDAFNASEDIINNARSFVNQAIQTDKQNAIAQDQAVPVDETGFPTVTADTVQPPVGTTPGGVVTSGDTTGGVGLGTIGGTLNQPTIDKINQIFRDELGRDPNEDEIDFFGRDLAKGTKRAFEIRQELQNTSEFRQIQETAQRQQRQQEFETGLGQIQQSALAQEEEAFKRATPEIIGAFMRAGRLSSSGLNAALANARAELSRERERFIGGLRAQELGQESGFSREQFVNQGNLGFQNLLRNLQNVQFRQQLPFSQLQTGAQFAQGRLGRQQELADFNRQRNDFLNFLAQQQSAASGAARQGLQGDILSALIRGGTGALTARLLR